MTRGDGCGVCNHGPLYQRVSKQREGAGVGVNEAWGTEDAACVVSLRKSGLGRAWTSQARFVASRHTSMADDCSETYPGDGDAQCEHCQSLILHPKNLKPKTEKTTWSLWAPTHSLTQIRLELSIFV